MELSSLSLIIPAYNEEYRLPDTFLKLVEYFSAYPRPYEVIVVDDGSSDDTRGVVESWKNNWKELKYFTLGQNCGKGAALARGVREAQMDWVLLFDADGSMPIDNLENFFQRLHSPKQILIASRDHPDAGQSRYNSPLRHYLGRGFVHFRKIVIGLNDIEDTQCGFKLFPRNAAVLLFENLSTDGFIFDVEVLARARKLRIPVQEVGVQWSDQARSKVNVIREFFRVPWNLFKIWRSLRKFAPGEDAVAILFPDPSLESVSQ